MIGLLFLFAACQEKVTSPAKVDTLPSIFPDYVGVTIPSTIAPLNFRVTDDGVEAVDVVIAGTKGKPVRLNGRSVDIPAKQWHELLESNKGDSIEVKVSVRQGKKWKEYRPFPIYVSPFPIDYGWYTVCSHPDMKCTARWGSTNVNFQHSARLLYLRIRR